MTPSLTSFGWVNNLSVVKGEITHNDQHKKRKLFQSQGETSFNLCTKVQESLVQQVRGNGMKVPEHHSEKASE